MALTKEEFDFLRATHRLLADEPLQPPNPIREPSPAVLDDPHHGQPIHQHVALHAVHRLHPLPGVPCPRHHAA